MSALSQLDWRDVRNQYDSRVRIHRQLLRFYGNGDFDQFVYLLLGISDPTGNYSADEHKLGPKILTNNRNSIDQVVGIAKKFIELKNARKVPELIREAAIQYLKIGVGSEASCMLNPDVCWVANTRTIWTHLVIKHADDLAKADEELRLYRSQDERSEMAYKIWAEIHRELAASMTRIAEEGERLAKAASIKPGPVRYLWADAIANALYSSYYD
ncbi:hypothetical protein SSBR45G_52580 [Bradyrhizobium sp. SSBR45G]|uniref:hypothetical protein n=1 Tax=unclassified Bradyrhizobium TaxID=2631580 RepID=UPI002342A33A|nr:MULTISPECIES: hypothetical protein [unclassified Bradyrhizobium]GLH80349.1 hypothetical protein SSBR45G_52580 [Bradyrhizobium sp. SSBR45G]GLH87843.1 hypothetical protein SSBR45R_53030 [Bradyrhizobium sp. SSBR45R]